MSARRASLLTATLLAAAVALTGCMPTPPAPPAESEAPATTEASSAPATDEAEEAEESSSAGQVAGEATAPGSELAYGDPATVEWVYNDGEEIGQMIEITVTGVREGAISDFEDAGLDQDFIDQLVGYQPLYVDIEATKLEPSERDLEYGSLYSEFGAVDVNGTDLQSISVFGTFEPCDTASLDPEFDEGQLHTSCIIVATREGQELGGATWEAYGSPYGFDGEPILWS